MVTDCDILRKLSGFFQKRRSVASHFVSPSLHELILHRRGMHPLLGSPAHPARFTTACVGLDLQGFGH